MSTAPVTAVIVSYRSRDMLGPALDGLREAHMKGLVEGILVDNASGDGTVESVRATHPWLEVVGLERNIGFGRACNLGIERSQTPYVLLLNPDASLPVDGLERLLAFAQAHPRAGILGPAIREANGALQKVGGLPSPATILHGALDSHWTPPGRRPLEPGEEPFRTVWLCGAVLLVSRAMLDEIGAFDPRFFLYFEETDLCHRALDAGWEIWCVGEAVARHHTASSATAAGLPMIYGCIAEHYFRSRFYYLVKHHGWAAGVATEVGEALIMLVVGCVRALARHDVSDFKARLRAPFLRLPARPA